jgi:hypothetical protein
MAKNLVRRTSNFLQCRLIPLFGNLCRPRNLYCFPRLRHAGDLLQSIASPMRQLVTRQTTTQFIGKNGTTLSTLLDPDQDPKGIDPVASWPDSLRCDGCLKRTNQNSPHSISVGAVGAGLRVRSRYYLTEEAICSV